MSIRTSFALCLIVLLAALGALVTIPSHPTRAAADNPGTMVMAPLLLPFVVNNVSSITAAPVITSTPALTATAGLTYTYDVNATGIPTPTYSLPVKPADMTIEPNSGLVQWTPAVTGTYSVTVLASNGIMPDATQPFTITVRDSVTITTAPTITSTPKLTATIGLSYTYDVAATGIPTPTYSLPVKPDGMTIDTNSGLIQWTPAVMGGYPVKVRASNGITPDAEQSFVVQVKEPPAIPEREWDPRLDQRFAELVEAQVQPEEGYWRLIVAQWLDEQEADTFGPDHHILMDVLDADGKRQINVNIQIVNGGASVERTMENSGYKWAADFPMFAKAPAYYAQPMGAPADRVKGLGLGSLEAPDSGAHTGYYLVWQWTIAPP